MIHSSQTVPVDYMIGTIPVSIKLLAKENIKEATAAWSHNGQKVETTQQRHSLMNG